MKPEQSTYDLIKSFEGCRLEAYQDQAGIWTIGWGTTKLGMGLNVKPDTVLTQSQADGWLKLEVDQKAAQIDKLLKTALNQTQYDSLVSFAYNAGIGALQSSTLLKRVNVNPSDPSIREAFMMWTKIHVDGKLVPNKGLENRRKAEADLYFS
jgi:lysozyme